MSDPIAPQGDPKAPRKISSIETGPEAKRFSTKIPGLDECLAESDDGAKGLPFGCSILLSGMPGGGKSTIATVIASAITDREALYGHGEERAVRVKQRWDRLKLSEADPFVVPLRAAEDFLDAIRDVSASPRGLGVTIADSIQNLTLNGRRKYDSQLEACEMVVGQVCAAGGVALLLSQVSKTGQDHAGAAALAHLVDIHMHLSVSSKKSERFLEIRKNRIGRAGFQVPVNMGISSISVGVPAPIAVGSGMGVARTQLEQTKEKALELLLEGKRLDFYDFDLAGAHGNLWRAGLEMAVKQLVREGHEVLDEKIKGRRGFRMVNPPPKGVVTVAVQPTLVAIDDANHLVTSAPAATLPPPTAEATEAAKQKAFEEALKTPVEDLPIELD